MGDLILRLYLKHKKTILGEMSMLHMGKRKKTNNELTPSYKLILRLFIIQTIEHSYSFDFNN